MAWVSRLDEQMVERIMRAVSPCSSLTGRFEIGVLASIDVSSERVLVESKKLPDVYRPIHQPLPPAISLPLSSYCASLLEAIDHSKHRSTFLVTVSPFFCLCSLSFVDFDACFLRQEHLTFLTEPGSECLEPLPFDKSGIRPSFIFRMSTPSTSMAF